MLKAAQLVSLTARSSDAGVRSAAGKQIPSSDHPQERRGALRGDGATTQVLSNQRLASKHLQLMLHSGVVFSSVADLVPSSGGNTDQATRKDRGWRGGGD